MRVAFVIDSLQMGGSERQCVLSAAQLIAHGHETAIFCHRSGNDFETFLKENQIELMSLAPYGASLARRVYWLAAHMRRGRYQVVHAFKASSSITGRLAARLAGVPCVFGGSRDQFRHSYLIRGLNRMLSVGTAGWIVNSEVVRKAIIRDYGASSDTVFVVPNAVQLERFQSTFSSPAAKERLGLAGDSIVISIVANLRPEKNHAMFLRFAGQLVRSGRDAKFIVAGDGPRRTEVRALSRRYGVEDRCLFLGNCSDISTVLRASEVVVLTSHLEGLPNALIEAGAAGIPSVSTDNGGASEVIVDGTTGFIVPREDAAAMAHRVSALLENPDLRRTMGLAAHERVTRLFSTEALYHGLFSAYSGGLRRGGAGVPLVRRRESARSRVDAAAE